MGNNLCKYFQLSAPGSSSRHGPHIHRHDHRENVNATKVGKGVKLAVVKGEVYIPTTSKPRPQGNSFLETNCLGPEADKRWLVDMKGFREDEITFTLDGVNLKIEGKQASRPEKLIRHSETISMPINSDVEALKIDRNRASGTLVLAYLPKKEDICLPFEVISKRLKEERVFQVEIANFSEYQANSKTLSPNSGFPFCVGETLGQPSTWRVIPLFENPEQMALYLSLQNGHEEGTKIFARFFASIKGNSGEDIVSCGKPTEQYSIGEGDGWDEFVTVDKLKAEGALEKDDTLTIHIKMVVYGDEHVKSYSNSKSTLQLEAMNYAIKYNERLLKTGENSDFVIRVKKGLNSQDYVERNVHRLILSSQSSVFEAMLGTQMSKKGVFTFEKMTPRGLDILLEFVYTGILSQDWRVVAEEIVAAAEKYNICVLKEYLGQNVNTTCN